MKKQYDVRRVYNSISLGHYISPGRIIVNSDKLLYNFVRGSVNVPCYDSLFRYEKSWDLSKYSILYLISNPKFLSNNCIDIKHINDYSCFDMTGTINILYTNPLRIAHIMRVSTKIIEKKEIGKIACCDFFYETSTGKIVASLGYKDEKDLGRFIYDKIMNTIHEPNKIKVTLFVTPEYEKHSNFFIENISESGRYNDYIFDIVVEDNLGEVIRPRNIIIDNIDDIVKIETKASSMYVDYLLEKFKNVPGIRTEINRKVQVPKIYHLLDDNIIHLNDYKKEQKVESQVEVVSDDFELSDSELNLLTEI